MTKQIVKDFIFRDWISELDSLNSEEAILWIKKNVPEGYYFDNDGDYDYREGQLVREREETDEEYSARLAKEQAEEEAREAEKVRKAYLLQNKINILKGQDLALSSYLEKHKDNPHIGDMENLFMALQQTLMHGRTGPVIEELEDCLKRLENGE